MHVNKTTIFYYVSNTLKTAINQQYRHIINTMFNLRYIKGKRIFAPFAPQISLYNENVSSYNRFEVIFMMEDFIRKISVMNMQTFMSKAAKR